MPAKKSFSLYLHLQVKLKKKEGCDVCLPPGLIYNENNENNVSNACKCSSSYAILF